MQSWAEHCQLRFPGSLRRKFIIKIVFCAGQAKWKKTLILAFQAIGIIYGEASGPHSHSAEWLLVGGTS